MTTTTTPDSTAGAARRTEDPQPVWTRVVVVSVALSAAVDVAVMALAGSVIPPVVVGVLLSLAGLALLRRSPRKALVLLAVVNGLLALTGAPFVLPHLAHPESAVDFVHSSVHLGGRLVALVAAIGALRAASPVGGRRLGRLAAGLLAATVLVGGVSTARADRDDSAAGDVTVAVDGFAFPSEVRVRPGATVFVDNKDLNRHTFTVAETDLSRELPGGAGVRVPIDLPPGTYRLFCAVTGHESMKAAPIVG